MQAPIRFQITQGKPFKFVGNNKVIFTPYSDIDANGKVTMMLTYMMTKKQSYKLWDISTIVDGFNSNSFEWL